MAYIFCYTKQGTGTYPDHNYPGLTGYLCDWEHAMHLAISDDGRKFVPLRNNTGILFPKCSFEEGRPQGTTKTLLDPWLCRAADGTFLVCCVRQNQNAPDPLSVGCMMLYRSKDLVFYEEAGFLRLSDTGIRRPGCAYDPQEQAYYLEWTDGEGTFCGFTKDFASVYKKHSCEASLTPAENPGIPDCVPGNVIEVSAKEAAFIRMYFDEIRHVGVEPIACSLPAGSVLRPEELPEAVCVYSDGSVHRKRVQWQEDALAQVDTSVPGEYQIPGIIQQKSWPFPIPLCFETETGEDVSAIGLPDGMSDPCVTEYRGKYYLTSSGNRRIVLRCAETIEGTFAAKPVIIYTVPLGECSCIGTWAAELHEIAGTLYLFTSICPDGDWTRVQSVVLRCAGDPLEEGAWEAPRYCVRPDGGPLIPGGISLDMTHFEDHGTHYVMWSGRKVYYGTEPLVAEPADIYIARINPETPWQLVSDPVCVIRPMYGWDRIESEVDEGPYLLRRGDDLFVTISGASTAMGDLYDVGLLRAKSGTDLMVPGNWEWLPYPLLTKESVPGEYGPGHNNFVKDPDTGDDLMIYHAIPHDGQDRALGRQPGIRRVHWAKSGLPYLEMTPERDLAPDLRQVVMQLRIE